MAVQVSGVHLAGAEVDPEPLRGIKTFVRDILPCQSHSSPEGGTTPILSDPGFEETQYDNSHLKRKSCLVEDESADSNESDSEHLPSSKRQRITVSAMRRLFAKFSLTDEDETSQPATVVGLSGTLSAVATTPQHSPDRAATPGSDTEDNLNDNTEQQSSSPNRSSPVTARSEKRISETDSDEKHGDKRQRTSERQTDCEQAEKQENGETKEEEEQHKENCDAEETKKIVATSEDLSKNNKRQAETRESDTEDKEVLGSKVKRTRRLRRGLRLSTNITCYIEQVLYN